MRKPGNGIPRGAASEMIVAADLLCREYEVFRNVAPSGADIIVRKSGVYKEIEVTTGKAGVNKFYYSAHRKGTWDILAVVVGQMIHYLNREFEPVEP